MPNSYKFINSLHGIKQETELVWQECNSWNARESMNWNIFMNTDLKGSGRENSGYEGNREEGHTDPNG